MLYDLRYILSIVPTEEQWTDQLRKGFLHGMKYFLKLLSYMEGMDAATRQIVQVRIRVFNHIRNWISIFSEQILRD